MVATNLVAVQAEMAFMARASVQAEVVFMARAIWVTRVAIISNPTKVISSNSSKSPGIRATQNS